MKKYLVFLHLIGLGLTAIGQDCEPYIPMEEGSFWEQTSYSPKGKAESRAEQKIVKKETGDNNLTAYIEGIIFNDKDEKQNEVSYTIRCQNGVFSVDLAGIMPSDQWANYESMTITLDGDFMELPSDPGVGDKLPDANLNVSIENAGVLFMTINVNVNNRVVASKETRTTPAGTFDCILITYDVTTQLGPLMKVKASTKEWYAKNAGLVRQENYNKSGKMTGYTELTKLTLP